MWVILFLGELEDCERDAWFTALLLCIFAEGLEKVLEIAAEEGQGFVFVRLVLPPRIYQK